MPDDLRSKTVAHTPFLAGEERLGPLDSRYVDPATLPWQPTGFPGIDWKILYRDEARGLLTAYLRWEPGSFLPMHEHVDVEQTWVLEGYLEDDQGRCGPGQFVWRPQGSRHVARAPEGAVMLAIFQCPNRFLEEGA